MYPNRTPEKTFYIVISLNSLRMYKSYHKYFPPQELLVTRMKCFGCFTSCYLHAEKSSFFGLSPTSLLAPLRAASDKSKWCISLSHDSKHSEKSDQRCEQRKASNTTSEWLPYIPEKHRFLMSRKYTNRIIKGISILDLYLIGTSKYTIYSYWCKK